MGVAVWGRPRKPGSVHQDCAADVGAPGHARRVAAGGVQRGGAQGPGKCQGPAGKLGVFYSARGPPVGAARGSAIGSAAYPNGVFVVDGAVAKFARCVGAGNAHPCAATRGPQSPRAAPLDPQGHVAATCTGQRQGRPAGIHDAVDGHAVFDAGGAVGQPTDGEPGVRRRGGSGGHRGRGGCGRCGGVAPPWVCTVAGCGVGSHPQAPAGACGAHREVAIGRGAGAGGQRHVRPAGRQRRNVVDGGPRRRGHGRLLLHGQAAGARFFAGEGLQLCGGHPRAPRRHV